MLAWVSNGTGEGWCGAWSDREEWADLRRDEVVVEHAGLTGHTGWLCSIWTRRKPSEALTGGLPGCFTKNKLVEPGFRWARDEVAITTWCWTENWGVSQSGPILKDATDLNDRLDVDVGRNHQ